MSTTSLFANLNMPPIGFGAAAISGEGGGYGFGLIAESEAISLVHEALELGVKLFDSAPIYGFGASEKRLGKALARRRDQAFVVSKCGVSWHANRRVNTTNDPEVALSMLHQSLRDLNTDYIDLYMVHWPDEKVDIRTTLAPLVRAQEVGKIKHLGLCNTHLEDLARAQEVANIRAVQNQLNFFERGALPLIEELLAQQISFMSWGTFDKGILTGSVRPGRIFDSADCRSWAPWWKAMEKGPRYEAIERLGPLVEKRGHTLAGLALGHNLGIPGVEVALCGMKNSTQLHSAWQAAAERVDPAFLEQCLDIARTTGALKE